MKRKLLLPLAFVFPVIACCASDPPPLRGTIPPGTPPPDYEAPRAYDPASATAAPAAQPAAPTAQPAAPTAAPAAPAPAPAATP